ncbi:hypothetical protein [Actinomyces howellii]|uniref:Uncharacterized protein n=1 Tax=Actinomyces howellii TaxID=52771 RepID=A0A3S4V4L6_9ACTO|nr:hypothetical protein [Actinomyces howellii]VEG28061.1 Uncharacterised protein [Actinomyces howellii]
MGAVVGLPARVWATIREPRTISLLMVGVYLTLLGMVWRVATAPVPMPPDVAAGLVALTLGCLAGAPSAWRGWWGVEAPAAGMVMLGLLVLAVEDIGRGVTAGHWPYYPVLLTISLVLMTAQRVLRIVGTDWEPGREPDTRARRARTALSVERVIEADALAAAASREEEPGCDQT